VLEHVGDVALVALLLGSARGEPAAIAAIHGPCLERLMERLVDTPVRGVLYEAAGSVSTTDLERGAETMAAASARWRIPTRLVRADPGDREAWLAQTIGAVDALV
jgi:hypothetical protein